MCQGFGFSSLTFELMGWELQQCFCADNHSSTVACGLPYSQHYTHAVIHVLLFLNYRTISACSSFVSISSVRVYVSCSCIACGLACGKVQVETEKLNN